MTNIALFAGIILGVFVIAGLTLGEAEAAAFAKYDGIDGEAAPSKDEKHNKWIDILSIDWGAKSTQVPGSPSTRDLVSDVTITMEYEKASPKLQEKCLKGEVIPKLEIEMTATYGGARATYLKYELKNVMVTSFDINASGNDEAGPPTVVMGNNFEEIKVTYTEYDDKGKSKGDTSFSYQLEPREPREKPSVEPQSFEKSYEVPQWYLTSISWLHQDLVSEDEIFDGLEYLKQQGILTI